MRQVAHREKTMAAEKKVEKKEEKKSKKGEKAERPAQEVVKTNTMGAVVPFAIGDTVNVHVKIYEGDKERVQVFSGSVIARKGGGTTENFTVAVFRMEWAWSGFSRFTRRISQRSKWRVRRGFAAQSSIICAISPARRPN